MIFVNYKTYDQATGERSVDLTKKLIKISGQYGVPVIPVTQSSDLKEIADTGVEVWAQHVDSNEPGAHTGTISAESVYADGAKGTFLNHSEHRFDNFSDLKKATIRARAVGLKILIFAADLTELKKNLKLKPDYISYEPPELVGSKTTSVAKAKPEVIKKAVLIADIAKIPLIVGAGIKSSLDIKKSLEYGASGFAVASFIVKAKNPAKAMETLLKGYK